MLGASWAAAPPADGTVRQSKGGPGGSGLLGLGRPLIRSAVIFNKKGVCSQASARPCGFWGAEGVPQGRGTAATPPQWPLRMPGRACVTCAFTSPHRLTSQYPYLSGARGTSSRA